jgi:hypothetical protein
LTFAIVAFAGGLLAGLPIFESRRSPSDRPHPALRSDARELLRTICRPKGELSVDLLTPIADRAAKNIGRAMGVAPDFLACRFGAPLHAKAVSTFAPGALNGDCRPQDRRDRLASPRAQCGLFGDGRVGSGRHRSVRRPGVTQRIA